MNDTDKLQLITYRLDQANDTVDVVSLLVENDMLSAAVNRIYYGIFYSLLALGLNYDFQTSKHQQLIGWFNREFIKSGLINTSFGIILRKAYESRTSGDYDSFCEFEKEEVALLFNEMKIFIAMIVEFIQINQNISFENH
jgi:uncharacterized protein (UPF0332 family)